MNLLQTENTFFNLSYLLLNSRNDQNDVEESGINHRINRGKLEYYRISQEISENSRLKAIFEGLKNMIALRQQQTAFSLYADQEVLYWEKKHLH